MDYSPASDIQQTTDTQQLLQIAHALVQLLRTATQVGALVVVACAALAGTYLLMFLVKSSLKQAIPESYKKLLGTTLAALTILAGVLGFLVGGGGGTGAITAGVAIVSAAFAGPLHRMIDGIAGLKARR